ncbi:Sugar ABC transporter sugar-binding protein [Thermobacillus xylanilyticus]|uniref:Sugar ABC transporter sugar-binding protein n=1 Tax=Thermobacillus xylanilyticus TaxID=76633 RepID=A0ABN7RXW8_THEXY|nr:sugar ABC transporter substrate-binding protein [Thermobacillus xylanilyticus]CAG5086437.1 Sugar ABC transporter sugar-binding protein [Thermobacillus xylanilyticus]
MKKRLSMLASVLLVIALVLSACGGGKNDNGANGGNGGNAANNGSSGNNSGGEPAQKVQIRLATWAGADEAKELQAILDDLNAKSGTYEIVQDSNPAEYDTRMITQLSGDSGPDLFWVSAQRAAQFAAGGVMLDITDRLASASHPAADTNDYYEASLGPFTHDGKIYGLPWLQQPVMMYVNKALFDEAGLDYPDESWTWNEFLDAAKKLTKDANGKRADEEGFDANNTVQWGFTLNGWPPAQMFIWQNGGEVITEDMKSSPIDTPEAKEALNFYADLVQGPLVPSQSIIRDRGFDQMFRNGQVAMFMGGAADNLDSTVENVQAFMVPAGPGGTHVTFGDILGMGINAKTKNPDAAFQALLDLTDAIHHWKIMPPRKSLADLETLKELHPNKAHSLEAIIASMEYARPYRYSEKYPDWDNIFWTQLMDPIINAGARPDDLIPKVKPLLDNALQ